MAVDLSHLSEAELDEMIAAGGAEAKRTGPDLSLLADDDIDAMLAERMPEVVEEMHPAFTVEDRLIAQNFAQDKAKAAQFLQGRHPDLEVSVSDDGRILAKGKDETAYRVLDPDTGFFSGDFLQDVGDVGYDVLAGVGTGAATAAGGILGGGVASLPTAAAAGGGAGAGLEALRQKAGQMLGIDQEVDTGDVVASGIGGAVSPLLFGTGATATQVAKKSLNPFAGAFTSGKPMMGAAEDALMASQRGVLGRAYDGFRSKISPKLGEMTSGIDADVIRAYRSNPGAVDDIDRVGVKAFIGEARDRLKGLVKDRRESVGRAIEEKIASATGSVDITTTRQIMDGMLKKLESVVGDSTNPAMRRAVKGIKKDIRGMFKGLPDLVPPQQAFLLKDALGQMSEVWKTTAASGFAAKGAGRAGTIADKRLSVAASRAAEELSGALEKVAGTGKLNREYRQISDLGKDLSKLLKDDKSAARRLANMKNPTNRVAFEELQQADKVLGSNMTSLVDTLAAHKNFSDASWLAKSGAGTTSTSRSVPLGLLGGGLGYYLGANSGLGQGGAGIGLVAGTALGSTIGGPAALRNYMRLQRKLSAQGNALRDSGLRPAQALPPVFWNMMQRDDEEKRQ